MATDALRHLPTCEVIAIERASKNNSIQERLTQGILYQSIQYYYC